MMPMDAYRLYEAERERNPAELRRAEEQAGHLAAVMSAARGARMGRPGRVARLVRRLSMAVRRRGAAPARGPGCPPAGPTAAAPWPDAEVR
jgi:hypothetical protein